MARMVDASYLATDRYDIAKVNAFELVIYGFSGAKEEGGAVSKDYHDDLILAVQTATLPTVGNEVIEIQDGNGIIKVLGGRTVEGGSIVLRDFVEPDVELRCQEWHDKANPRRADGKRYAVARVSDYKYDGVLYQYHAGDIVRKWELYGIIPTSIAFGELDKTNRGDIKTIDLTVEYDDAYREKATTR